MSAGGPPSVEVNPFAAPRARDDAPAPPVGGGGFRSLTPLATAISVVMVLFVLVKGANVLADVASISVVRHAQSGTTFDTSALQSVDAGLQALQLAATGLYIAGGILFCIYISRAIRNAWRFGSWPMSLTPRRAALSFFRPIAGWYRPYKAMKEAWLGSAPDGTRTPSTVPFPGVFGWWWGFYLGQGFVAGAASFFLWDRTTPDGILRGLAAEIVHSLVAIVSAVLARVVVRALAWRQDQRQLRYPAGTPVPQA